MVNDHSERWRLYLEVEWGCGWDNLLGRVRCLFLAKCSRVILGWCRHGQWCWWEPQKDPWVMQSSPSGWLWGHLQLLSWRFQKGRGPLAGNNSNNSMCCLPDTVLGIWHLLTRSIITTTLGRRYYCPPHIMDEGAETQRYRNFTRSSSKWWKQTHVLSRDFYNHHSIWPPTWLAVNTTYTCALCLCLLPYYIFSNSRLCQNCPSPALYSKFVFVYPCAVIWATRWGPTLGPGQPSLFWVLQAFTQIQFTVGRGCAHPNKYRERVQEIFFLMIQTQEKVQIAIQSLIEHFQYMKSVPSHVLFHFLILIAPKWSGHWGLWLQ